ncbi:MAG TPA: hypothetical protein VM911_17590 [Pyrinomonadaceae bacterium]|jgi:hypothetical protein|nr:hypothetical protein [Pyrinomonadaceae bacterium]
MPDKQEYVVATWMVPYNTFSQQISPNGEPEAFMEGLETPAGFMELGFQLINVVAWDGQLLFFFQKPMTIDEPS